MKCNEICLCHVKSMQSTIGIKIRSRMIGLCQNETNQLCHEINRIDTMGDDNKLVTAYINSYIGEGGHIS